METIKRIVQDLKKYFPYCVYSAKASLKAEVAGSYLNWLWWILNPFCFMLIYAFIFGVVFNSSELYFPIFLFIGITIWNFFSQTITHSVSIVKGRKGILNKVYVPKYIFILSDMLAAGFKMLISFGIVVLMMIFYHVPVSWKVICIIPAIIELFLISFLCSLFLSHFGVFIQDLTNIVSIGLRLMMYFTGVFYDIKNRMPKLIGDWIMRLNPIAGIMSQVRGALLYCDVIHMRKAVIWIILSIVFSIFGIKLIYKNENNYVKVI